MKRTSVRVRAGTAVRSELRRPFSELEPLRAAGLGSGDQVAEQGRSQQGRQGRLAFGKGIERFGVVG
ncbi:MAG: hypothetical protein FJ100_22500 [Deltaproteobacteria bacterium]|nr:hypothetical protein [Deltaproteobacteria bacterium]